MISIEVKEKQLGKDDMRSSFWIIPKRWSPYVSSYLEAGDLPDNGLAESCDGIWVLTDWDHVIIPDNREALVGQELLSDFAQAVLQLWVLTHICMGSH